jgi:hypothetical protein
MSSDGSRVPVVDPPEWVPECPLRRRLRARLSWLSFWAAVALPALYVPVVLVDVDADTRAVAFLGLFGVNLAALVVGHSYSPD